MAKPSIFSKNYKKQMKRIRRRRIITTIVVVILFIFGFVYLNNRNSFDFSKIISNESKEKVREKETVKEDKVKEDTTKESDTKPILEEKDYIFNLSDGTEIKLIYTENNGEKLFKTVTGDSDKYTYSINPAGNKLIVFDSVAQSIVLIDTEGNKTDITKKKYVSDSSKSVFVKENILKSKPTYIWAFAPNFIDNDNIAYISQLPWFNKEKVKYLWTLNINEPENHKVHEDIKGQNIEFGKIEANCLSITIDGTTKYIDSKGNIVAGVN